MVVHASSGIAVIAFFTNGSMRTVTENHALARTAALMKSWR
jgi:hypothetical protein